MTLTHGKGVTLEQITAYAKKRQLSDQNRILSHARNVLVQREIRRSMNASLRKAELEHIGKIFPSDAGNHDMARLRRELFFLVLSKMAKVGMRHRESFNELVGNLSRDAVQLTHPNRMALLAMNNKIFSDGLENHLEAQQPTQNPTQQVYNPPPPQTAPYVPAGAAASAAAPADGPPSWMQAGARMGLGALTGLAKTGVAAAKVIHASYQAQEAARQAAQATAIMDDDFDLHLMVMIFVQSQEGVIPWQLKMHSNFTRCRCGIMLRTWRRQELRVSEMRSQWLRIHIREIHLMMEVRHSGS